jgi:hypothetical protein
MQYKRRGTLRRAMIANEKRRRRRESHNAVERRRRDNINEKIGELATLIPECMLDVGGTPLDLPLSLPMLELIIISFAPGACTNSDIANSR